MGTLFIYAIKSAICLALLYLPYTLLMRKETFHSFNRKALLMVILLSLILPFISIPMWNSAILTALQGQKEAIIEIGIPTLTGASTVSSQAIEADATAESSISWANLLVLIYIIGVIVCLIWKVVEVVRLERFIPKSCLWTEKKDGINIFCHVGKVSPFSWMKNIVIGEDDYNLHPSVLIHEKAHIKLLHSWDTILLSLVEVLQWFNPCIWMLDLTMKEVHEFEADDAVLRSGISAKQYQLLLIEKAVAGSKYSFANGFNHSLLKKRFIMMMKDKSNKWNRTKMLYLIPAAAIALTAFATNESLTEAFAPEEKADSQQATAIATDSQTGEIVTQKANLAANNDSPANNDAVFSEPDDSITELMKKIPGAKIDENGKATLNGKDITKVLVNGKEVSADNNERKLLDVTVSRTDKAKSQADNERKLLDVTVSRTDKTNESNERKLLDVTVSRTGKANEATDTDDDIWQVVEEMPEFEGGAEAMMAFLAKTIKYPASAIEMGIQGRVMVKFVVDKTGIIRDTEIAKSVDADHTYMPSRKNEQGEELTPEQYQQLYAKYEAGCKACDDEALRCVKAMPKWKPGKQRGKAVNVSFTIPISFRLR